METVISCTKVRDWTKDGKSVPIYSVALSDGQGGESFGKEIPVGTPMSELQLETSQYGLKIKWNKPGASNGFSGGRQRSGNESFALSYAKDYAVAKVGSGKEFKGDDILKLADLFYNWLEKKKGTTAPSAPVVLASQLPAKDDSQDLPF